MGIITSITPVLFAVRSFQPAIPMMNLNLEMNMHFVFAENK